MKIKSLNLNILVLLIICVVQISCNNTKEKSKFELLNEARIGNLANINILVKHKDYTRTEILELAKEAKEIYCSSKNCNIISCWDNKESYNMYIDNRTTIEDEQWMKMNWKIICEGLVFDNNVYVDEVVVYPLIDDQYRNYGGSKVKPK